MAKRKATKSDAANEFITEPGISAWGESGENMVDEPDDDKWAEMIRKKIKGRPKNYKPPTREESRKKARERAKKRASSRKKATTGKGFTLYWPWPAPSNSDSD